MFLGPPLDASMLSRTLDMPALPRLLAVASPLRPLFDKELPRLLRWLVSGVLAVLLGALVAVPRDRRSD